MVVAGETISSVWVGSWGYEDCDPIGGVVAIQRHQAEGMLRQAVLGEIDRSRNSCDGECDDEDTCPMCSPSIWETGVMCEALASLGLTNEQLADLETDGYCWD